MWKTDELYSSHATIIIKKKNAVFKAIGGEWNLNKYIISNAVLFQANNIRCNQGIARSKWETKNKSYNLVTYKKRGGGGGGDEGT